MDLSLRTEDAEFRRQILGFLAAHWPPEGRTQRWLLARSAGYETRADVKQWRAALVAHGYSVPHWPVAAGGPNWSASQRSIWDRETTLAKVPDTANFGIARVGPLLTRFGTRAQCERHLAGIREYRHPWCLACAEPGTGMNLALSQTRLERRGERYLVSGTKAIRLSGQSDVQHPGWALLVVGGDGLAGGEPDDMKFLLVDLAGSGIEIHTAAQPSEVRGTGAGGNQRVRFNRAEVPCESELGASNSARDLWQALFQPACSSSTRVASNRIALEGLQQFIEQKVPPELAPELQALEVAQAGHEALEQRLRYSMVATPIKGVLEPPPMEALLMLKTQQMGLRIAQLAQDALGYYALPDPDPALLANEGPIGPEYALVAMQGMLGSRGAAEDVSAEQIQWYKDIIAKSALSL